jgi:hypothetical protein
VVFFMPAETLGKPSPTPHPDPTAETASDLDHRSSPLGEPVANESGESDEPTYDSCLDDLDVILAQPVTEPDPVLQSRSSAEEGPRAAKRTSELFETGGSLFGMGGPASAKARGVLSTVLSSILPGSKRTSEPAASPQGRSVLEGSSEQGGGDFATPDSDTRSESRMNWILLLLLSYGSAVSLALGWVLWTGRALRTPEMMATDTRQAGAEPSTSSPEQIKSAPLPPVPAENQASLGQTVRIGDLEITPLAINSAKVELVGMVEPYDYRLEDTDSLFLRLRVTNVSKENAFTPLDRILIRDQASPLDRSLIITSGKAPIGLFPLAIDSEWLIQGQVFPLLKPGESAETLLASEAVTDDRLVGEMSWRVRLRTGPYRTDVLAVRFTKEDVMP